MSTPRVRRMSRLRLRLALRLLGVKPGVRVIEWSDDELGVWYDTRPNDLAEIVVIDVQRRRRGAA